LLTWFRSCGCVHDHNSILSASHFVGAIYCPSAPSSRLYPACSAHCLEGYGLTWRLVLSCFSQSSISCGTQFAIDPFHHHPSYQALASPDLFQHQSTTLPIRACHLGHPCMATYASFDLISIEIVQCHDVYRVVNNKIHFYWP